jgi:hypothetical protein
MKLMYTINFNCVGCVDRTCEGIIQYDAQIHYFSSAVECYNLCRHITESEMPLHLNSLCTNGGFKNTFEVPSSETHAYI